MSEAQLAVWQRWRFGAQHISYFPFRSCTFPEWFTFNRFATSLRAELARDLRRVPNKYRRVIYSRWIRTSRYRAFGTVTFAVAVPLSSPGKGLGGGFSGASSSQKMIKETMM